VFIGLDGWGGTYMPKANMPTVKRMMDAGSSGNDMLCIKPSSSWPNWTALFRGTLPIYQTEINFPSIFSIVTDTGNKSVFFHEWDLLQSICPDETVEKFNIRSDYDSALKIASYIIERKPVFTAVVFNEPDTLGHRKGWGSMAYHNMLSSLDNYIGIIEQAVKDAEIYENTIFVLSSDHGGSLWGHGLYTYRHRRIPLVIYGKGIKEGYIIPFGPNIYDIAPTMAAILGMETPPEWTGRPLFDIFK
jgi:predicted AlkP superfamily pyrophosphatase or phosphodiesterase